MRIRLTASAPRVDMQRRMIAGTVFRYGEVGFTSAGPLRVRAGALNWPVELGNVPLTLEHTQPYTVRGAVALVDDNEERMYVAFRVVDGELGDAALNEAVDRGPTGRGGLSFDLENTLVEGDEIVAGDVVAIGQVRDPAFNSARIDQIAASSTSPATQGTQPGGNMTPEQIARLAALRAQQTLTDAERAELDQLVAAEAAAQTPAVAAPATPAPPVQAPAAAAPAGQPVAASIPAVPAGVPSPALTRPRGSSIEEFARQVCSAIREGRPIQSITAALTDIVYSDSGADISVPAWSGELWSGVGYDPIWTPLFNSGTMTALTGRGWRFTTKPEIEDYAGDKAEIPSNDVETEDSTWTGARMAVGHDFDRAFFDFPSEGYFTGYLNAVRESWAKKLDAKVRAYVLAQDVPVTRTVAISTTNADATVTAPAGAITSEDVGATITGTGIPASTTILSVTNATTFELSANATATGTPTATVGVQSSSLLKAASRAVRQLRRAQVGKATFVVVNDDDFESLFDLTNMDVPAYLEKLLGLSPENFVQDQNLPSGTVIAGVRQAATVRTLPGSPIRVEAQNLTRAGVDEAFFGYWAIEEHHTSGIVSVQFTPENA